MNNLTGREEMFDLLAAVCNGTITAHEHQRLEQLLAADAAARQFYFDYLDLHLHLRQWQRTQAMPAAANESVDLPSPSPIPPIVIDPSPAAQPLFNLQSQLGGFLFSYLAATVVLGIGLLVGALVQVSRDAAAPIGAGRIADRRHETIRQFVPTVGRITGLLDCRLADSAGDIVERAAVPLGRKYILTAGFMEITYDSGAKVILQGPCRYEVESPRGGFLALGRLTARVESREWKVESRESRAESSDRQQDGSQLSTLNSRLFSIRTPTAVVTDLGTEFGVEVNEEGSTTSHVFRGAVKVQAVGGRGRVRDAVLRENQSTRVQRVAGADGPQLTSFRADPSSFVRRLDRTPKQLDLLDVVAGGNGIGRHRDRGIDPTTGMEDPLCFMGERSGDRRYRPVAWHKLIDGVFIPDGRGGAVQLDSARHASDQFPPTTGSLWGSIWSLAADAQPNKYHEGWIYEIQDRRRFTPQGRGLLALSPNVGITFNLEAARRIYPSVRPARFQAIAGLGDRPGFNPSATSRVDLWVFVDGQLKLKRPGLCRRDGTLRMDVELAPTDRFLTLAATDGGDGLAGDWLVLGDPVLQLVPAASETPAGN
jgi:hypothetical protein